MGFLRNILALIGLVVVLGIAAGASRVMAIRDSFDPQAGEVYLRLGKQLLETGDPVAATVWKAKVKAGLSFEEVDEAIKSVATAMNIKGVGELPLGAQVSAMKGTPWRKLNIYLYCNPLTAANMVDYSDAYAAYLPCRISLLEDKTGALWIYTMDMDMMIHGGKPLPPALKEEALKVKQIMLSILEKGASGDF